MEYYTLPLILNTEDNAPVEEDLSIALAFRSLEDEREKGGGIIRKKRPERITCVAVVHRPILILRYGSAMTAFDGCGIVTTRVKYGITPSFTHIQNYLISDTWTTKPESYAEGLNSHSQEFEQATGEYVQELQGWITNSDLLAEVARLLNVSLPSGPNPDSLPLSINFDQAKDSLAKLDAIKFHLRGEITPLKNIKQKVNERTSEVLSSLNRERILIEEKFNREIERIRPSVLKMKERYENERMEQRQRIENRFSGRLHDSRNRRDAASAKIDAYNPDSGREPKGGIDRQYSIKQNAERRIRELKKEQEQQMDLLNEKYDALIEEQQEQINSIERRKDAALEEPKRKIKAVNSATSRLTRAMGELLENHESVIALGSSCGVAIPPHFENTEFVVYLPTVFAEFTEGSKSRIIFQPPRQLKSGKGILGGIKGLVGFKFMPLDTSNQSLFQFVNSISEHPKVRLACMTLANRINLLRNPDTINIISSGTTKMQTRGWLKEKESIEFRRSVSENYHPQGSIASSSSSEIGIPVKATSTRQEDEKRVRILDFRGIEEWVTLDELDKRRREDEDQFAKGARTAKELSQKKEEQGELLNLVHDAIQDFKPSKRYHNEFPYQTELQGWLKSKFPSATIEIQTGASRPDIVIEDIAIEVKGPTDNNALNTLTTKCLKYSHYYNKIILCLFEPVFSESNFREIEAGIAQHFPHVRVVRKDATY
jgi:hypothetical protein